VPTVCLSVYLSHALRDELEEMLAPFLGRLDIVLRKALEESGGAALMLTGAVSENDLKNLYQYRTATLDPMHALQEPVTAHKSVSRRGSRACVVMRPVWKSAWFLRHCSCWGLTLSSTIWDIEAEAA